MSYLSQSVRKKGDKADSQAGQAAQTSSMYAVLSHVVILP